MAVPSLLRLASDETEVERYLFDGRCVVENRLGSLLPLINPIGIAGGGRRNKGLARSLFSQVHPQVARLCSPGLPSSDESDRLISSQHVFGNTILTYLLMYTVNLKEVLFYCKFKGQNSKLKKNI